ncbi:MAG TPA: serine hydrolase domain-containing protein [Steroidobacteraceae bacterium]|jgi:CubicO group peptidase (beta-lactamase class C family)|nr:serine hydrolase domain-containing protein [Steroidobacteraceae bacterium]
MPRGSGSAAGVAPAALFAAALFAAALLAAAAGAATAEGAAPNAAAADATAAMAPSQPAPPVIDGARVQTWMDAQVPPALRLSGVPGAVVVIVRHDGVIFSKGYGLADIRRAIPLRADTTLLDIASIGKSMTALIASQLIDEGALDIDADVNRYLKSAQVTGPKVTLRMLFGHRGGFDADLTGLFVPLDGDTRMKPGEADRRLRPIGNPGWVTGYDNQGYGIIGLVLRDVTGKSFDELYRERLFDPAGMSSAVQGRPTDGDARLAACHVVRGPDAITPCPYWLYRDALRGAGGVAASGEDMGRYMRLLLNDGALEGRRVLSARAFTALTDFDAYRFRPGLPGMARSFTQLEELRGLEYAHGGSMPGFSSIMKIYRDADVGVFVCILGGEPGSFDYNLSGSVRALRDLDVEPASKPAMLALRTLAERFADEFIPAVWPRSSAGARVEAGSAPENLQPFLGHYLATENKTRSFALRVASWLGGIDVIRVDGERIGVAGLGVYRRVGPYLYEDAKGRRLAFADLPVGRFVAIGLSPGVFRKTGALESPVWTLPLMLAATLGVLTALGRLGARTPLRLRRPATFAIVGYLLVLAGLALEWQYGVRLAVVDGAIVLPALWRAALHIGAIMLLWSAATFTVPSLGSATGGGGMSRAAQAHGVLIAASGASVVAVLILWRVIGAFPPYFSW